MKYAFLFSGQGAQYPGMGQELYASKPLYRATVDEASNILGYDMSEIMFSDDGRLNQTAYTQPAMLTMSWGLTRLMQEEGFNNPAAVAGLSLGEYTALLASETLSFSEVLPLIEKRGQFMSEAVPDGKGAMAAVMNIAVSKIEEVCQHLQKDRQEVFIANYNMPLQTVITGEYHAVVKAKELLEKEPRSKVVMLNVSGPFHSPFMQPAAQKLERTLATLVFAPMTCPIYSNVTGRPMTESELKALLVKQVMSPVHWQQTIENMIADDINVFIELGPGKTLTRFVKKINRHVQVMHVEDEQTLEKTCLKLRDLGG